MRRQSTIGQPIVTRIRRTARMACLLGLVALGAAVSATPAVAEGCPNEQLRSENNSTRLPECRAYEMVTPLYKEGFPVFPTTFSDEGAFTYRETGNYAGANSGSVVNQDVATRSTAGWTTTTLNPPAATYAILTATGEEVHALSPDFRLSLWSAQRLEPPADAAEALYLRDPNGAFTRIGNPDVPGVVVGEPAFPVGASADLSHILFSHGINGFGTAELAALYEFVGTGNEGPPSPVSVDNDGNQLPPEACPSGISADGRVIVFNSGCRIGLPQVWARVGGSATIAVSGSECMRSTGDPGGACNAVAPASFVGMSADGSRAYFTTTQQLVNGDTDQTNDLYECEIPPGAPAPVGAANACASLTEVSHNVTGANVENVVNVSEDGTRVYFVATGVLASNLGTNDAPPVAGDSNLYLWEKDASHPAGQTTFVATLESDDISRAQSTPDRRYLIFDTASKLVASDTDEVTDVYRYDADTGTLLRLSTDVSGTGGNTPAVNAEAASPSSEGKLPHPAITHDGNTVIFETSEALSPADTDGVTDVYEWHEGQVSLISNGGVSAFGAIGITPSGRDIFFKTAQPLTPGDSGTEEDVYDARVEGGFPVNTPQSCSDEACHGALALQPQVPSASGSATLSGPGSPLATETPPTNSATSKAPTLAQKLAKALKACRTKHRKKQRKTCEKKARNTYRRAK